MNHGKANKAVVKYYCYAILGDDIVIVIGHRTVAEVYRRESSLADLGLRSLTKKSIRSTSLSFEFATRFRVKCGTWTRSPVSMRCIFMCAVYAAFLSRFFFTTG